jgi:stage III sporulation protein SpoIIIAA
MKNNALSNNMLLADNLNQLLEILPEFISKPLQQNESRTQLIEIVLDIGRRPEARFADETKYLSYKTIVWQDIEYILKRLGKFSGDNRAGIEKTLHRVSALRNRNGGVIGLTCRIGRAVFGTVNIICDLLEKRKSILLLGRPGVGKTTAIREIARVLSDDMQKRVIIIDTSNEIAGDGDLPHPSIGKARRMQVRNPQNQHQVMIEAVENHMPEIIVIDEIGTELEAMAARTIAERGVQLVGTAHGRALDNLVKNPTLTDLIGGVQYVTLGDEEARRRGSSKSILERKAPPTFEVAVEIHNPKMWVIHENVERSVDLLLQGQPLPLQKRELSPMTSNIIRCTVASFQKGGDLSASIETSMPITHKKQKYLPSFPQFTHEDYFKNQRLTKTAPLSRKELSKHFIFLYVYGINGQDLRSLINALNLPIILTREIQYADNVLSLGNLLKNNKKLRQVSIFRNMNVSTIPNNNLLQIAKILKQIVTLNSESNAAKKDERITRSGIRLLTPLEEVQLTIEEIIMSQQRAINLLPRSQAVRKLQHELINHYQLRSVSIGKEPHCYIRIYPNQTGKRVKS